MNWRFWTRTLGDPQEDHEVTMGKRRPAINVTAKAGESIVLTYTLTVTTDDLIQDREAIRRNCQFKAERMVNRFIDGIKIDE